MSPKLDSFPSLNSGKRSDSFKTLSQKLDGSLDILHDVTHIALFVCLFVYLGNSAAVKTTG